MLATVARATRSRAANCAVRMKKPPAKYTPVATPEQFSVGGRGHGETHSGFAASHIDWARVARRQNALRRAGGHFPQLVGQPIFRGVQHPCIRFSKVGLFKLDHSLVGRTRQAKGLGPRFVTDGAVAAESALIHTGQHGNLAIHVVVDAHLGLLWM